MATRPKDEANTKGAKGAASDGAPDADGQQAAVEDHQKKHPGSRRVLNGTRVPPLVPAAPGRALVAPARRADGEHLRLDGGMRQRDPLRQ
jgi:hypothetical protein